MIKKLSILFLFLPVIVCGQYFPQPQTVTMGTPYCYRGGMTDKIQTLPDDPGFFRAKKNGCIGDGITDDTDSITALIAKAEAYYAGTGKPTVIYFAQGTYKTDFFNVLKSEITVRGKHHDLSIIKPYTAKFGAATCNYKTIGITDIAGDDYYLSGKSIRFDDCKFTVTNAWSAGDYLHNWGFYTNPRKVTYSHCDFIYDSIYMGVHAYYLGVDTLLIYNSTFSGTWSTHPIRIEKTDYFDVSYNDVSGGVTGIMLASTRTNILSSGKIMHNTVHGQTEEGITFDGFGNNTALCPVIGQGAITTVTNDGNGRLIINTTMEQRNGTHPADTSAPLLISDRSDWTEFYYCFDKGTGREGEYYKILSFDTTHNTLTIDKIISKDSVTVGGTASVDAGFYNIKISNNEVYNVSSGGGVYGTGISLYLNVFNSEVSYNNVHDCVRGGYALGGLMLNFYRTKAWDNNIHDNTFTNCSDYGFNVYNLYSTDVNGYDNIVKNNVFNAATFQYSQQVRFTNTGNTITP